MSGIYLIGVIALWLWLTWLLWKGWIRWRKFGDNRKLRDITAFLLAFLWFSLSFWYAGGRVIYYDWQVERMCVVDGGVKVYETVELPEGEFSKLGMLKNLHEIIKGKNGLGKYFNYKIETIYYRNANPSLLRLHIKIIRQADGNLLGESVFYKRGGGDLYGPWHGSSYMCPKLSAENDVIRQVFIKE